MSPRRGGSAIVVALHDVEPVADERVTGACRSCGAPHSRGAVYCWKCGQPLMLLADGAAPRA